MYVYIYACTEREREREREILAAITGALGFRNRAKWSTGMMILVLFERLRNEDGARAESSTP
jgi:hypothetical protein